MSESLATFSRSLDVIITNIDDFIDLCKMPDKFLPKVLISIKIDKSFNVQAFMTPPLRICTGS